MDETIAIQRIRHGDASGLEYLVQKHQARALQASWLILRDQALAEDAVSQAFLKAFQKVRQLREDAPFGPWFYRIVVNQSLDLYRKEQRQTAIGEEWMEALTAPGPALEASLERAQSMEELHEAIGRLQPEHRAALVARYFLGLGEKETARRLDKPLSTVKWWLRTARQQLRLALAPNEREFRKELKDD